MERYQVHTNFIGTPTKVYEFTNATLPEPENLSILRALFEAPDSLHPGETVESVTKKVAANFADLADAQRDRGIEPQRAARFIDKLLFCLFAEDIGLLPKGLFTELAERTAKHPERFERFARELFKAMEQGGYFQYEDIRYFDGGLFRDADVVALEAEELKILAEAARADWGSVEPAIFGTLFQRFLDPSEKAQLEAQYTTLEDINVV